MAVATDERQASWERQAGAYLDELFLAEVDAENGDLREVSLCSP
jgi:hypothetical protein